MMFSGINGSGASSSASYRAIQSVLVLFFIFLLDFSFRILDMARNNVVSDEQEKCPALDDTTSFSFTKLNTPYQLHPSPLDPSLLFYLNPDAMKGIAPIPFQEEWINDFGVAPHEDDAGSNRTWLVPEPPQELPVPHYMQVLDLSAAAIATLSEDATTRSGLLAMVAQQARKLIDQHLDHESGAMLFRNLHHVIHNASDFAVFWNHVTQSNPDDHYKNNNNKNSNRNWNVMVDHLSCYNRKRQRLYDQVDRVDTDVPAMTIGPHNEHSCNPHASDRIFLYALHAAVRGGESLLRRNRDMSIPQQAWDILQDQNARHGGALLFSRSYPDAAMLETVPLEHRHPTAMSWQERCKTNSTLVARRYFERNHGITNVTFDAMDGTLTAYNLLPGYHSHHHHDDDKNHRSFLSSTQSSPVWFNRIDYGFPVTLADGTMFPLDLQAYLKRQKWHETSALKLQRGDWLVLDNRRVQHGRLPYSDDDDSRHLPLCAPKPSPRQLLVTYTTTATTTTQSSSILGD